MSGIPAIGPANTCIDRDEIEVDGQRVLPRLDVGLDPDASTPHVDILASPSRGDSLMAQLAEGNVPPRSRSPTSAGRR